MEEKKKLKKLVLKKEEIVNLNDYQMRQIQGGGSISGVISKISKYTVDYTISETIDQIIDYADGYMRDHSWYGCAPQISEEKYMGGCLLPEVNVYP